MDHPTGTNIPVSEEQLAYATLLDHGWKLGFVMMLGFFTLYVFGIVPAHVPLNELPNYWALSSVEYGKATNIHQGWSWVYLVGKGDYLCFVGIAFLALITSACYLRILPIFMKRKDTIYTIIVVLETLVLALAASGILAAGH